MIRVVAPVAHCHILLYITGAFVALAISSTSLLFFYRVRAVYSNSCIITSFFGFLWVATSGLSILNSFSIYGGVSPFAPDLCPKCSYLRFSRRIYLAHGTDT